MSKPINIYRVKDKKEKYYTKKGLLFDLPMKLLIIGKSQYSGKSSCIVNLLLQDDTRLYKNDFKGDDIYIFSGSIKTDNKIKMLIKNYDIPEENLFNDKDDIDETLEAIYDLTEEEYNEAIENGEKPKNTLIILDDMAFGGDLKKKNNGMINKVFCNGRHINLSIIATAQKYSQLHTTQRENCSGVILFDCSDKQLETIVEDHNIFDKKATFKKMFRERTKEPYSFMVINYSNNKKDRFLSMNFEPIGPCGKTKKEGCKCL